MMILGIPVMDQHRLTNQLIESLAEKTQNPSELHVVIIDNNSEVPYHADYHTPFPVTVIRNERNDGYYYPLRTLYETFPHADAIGLIHNDMIIYEQGWDERIRGCFARDPQLGLIGFCGSWQADHLGGRGGGTMCHFNGSKGQPQSAGERIDDLRPSVLLDSLFMMFRLAAIPGLRIDEHIAPCHFYDKIWSMRTIENGWRVATLGVEVDHIGGQTAVGVARFREDARQWCEQEGCMHLSPDPLTALYLEAERRFLTEYRDQKRMMPSHVTPNYTFVRT